MSHEGAEREARELERRLISDYWLEKYIPRAAPPAATERRAFLDAVMYGRSPAFIFRRGDETLLDELLKARHGEVRVVKTTATECNPFAGAIEALYIDDFVDFDDGPDREKLLLLCPVR